MSDIGKRIKEKRKILGYTQKDLCDKIEISQGSLSEIEKNKYVPNGNVLIKLSEELKCSIDWLLKGDEYPEVTHSATSDYSELFSQLNEANKKETLEFIKFKLKLQNPNSGDTNNSSIA